MSHPKSRRERFLIGQRKGKKRAFGYWNGAKQISSEKEKVSFNEKNAQLRRDTTKLCSCSMCGNPRRKSWKNKLTIQEKKFNEALIEN
jgi:hypothetical protein